MPLVPVSGQLNCTQWRKLNAYDTVTERARQNILLRKGEGERDVIAGDFHKSKSRVDNFKHVLFYFERMKKKYFINNFEIIYFSLVVFKISTLL